MSVTRGDRRRRAPRLARHFTATSVIIAERRPPAPQMNEALATRTASILFARWTPDSARTLGVLCADTDNLQVKATEAH